MTLSTWDWLVETSESAKLDRLSARIRSCLTQVGGIGWPFGACPDPARLSAALFDMSPKRKRFCRLRRWLLASRWIRPCEALGKDPVAFCIARWCHSTE